MHRFFAWFGLPGKLVLTALISLTAIVLAVIDPTPTRIICIPAMLLSSLGDIILMNYKPITKNLPVKGFIAGAVAFAAAHVIYFAAFLFSVKGRYFNVGAICGIALFVLISVCMPLIFPHGRGENRMLFLGLLYLFFIALNYITVYSCAASHGGIFWVSAVGVTSFLISDLFIAADKILGRKKKNSDLWIWTLYPIGQLLLLIGA